MKLVVIESPYSPGKAIHCDSHGWLRAKQHELYLRACLRDSIARGESPYASHRMFTDCLDDTVPDQRDLGIGLGFAWAEKADARVFYLDRGMTPGMWAGLNHAIRIGQPRFIRGMDEWRTPARLEALKKLAGYLDVVNVDVDWAGF